MKYISLFFILALAAFGESQVQPAPDPAPDTGSLKIANQCLEDGEGKNPGDRLANASFTNCLGETVWLHDTCGETPLKALIISTVWCPACKSTLRGLTYDYQISGGTWDYLIIVAEDASRSSDVSLEECLAYAEQVDADPAKMVLDPGFHQTWQGGLINLCTNNGSLSLPFMSILDGDDNKYEYSRSCQGSAENGYTNWRDAFLGELNEQ